MINGVYGEWGIYLLHWEHIGKASIWHEIRNYQW